MNEKPILFSGPMVRAILAGKKTQTRRIIRADLGDPEFWEPKRPGAWDYWDATTNQTEERYSPYGEPGDRLWVRETWTRIEVDGGDHEVLYRADDGEDLVPGADRVWNWKPSIFMPRAASRISLEVTNLRVERLQAITEEDAKAEGVGVENCGVGEDGGPIKSHRTAYARLWDTINGDRGLWAENPWVWVVEFKRAAVPPEAP